MNSVWSAEVGGAGMSSIATWSGAWSSSLANWQLQLWKSKQPSCPTWVHNLTLDYPVILTFACRHIGWVGLEGNSNTRKWPSSENTLHRKTGNYGPMWGMVDSYRSLRGDWGAAYWTQAVQTTGWRGVETPLSHLWVPMWWPLAYVSVTKFWDYLRKSINSGMDYCYSLMWQSRFQVQ